MSWLPSALSRRGARQLSSQELNDHLQFLLSVPGGCSVATVDPLSLQGTDMQGLRKLGMGSSRRDKFVSQCLLRLGFAGMTWKREALLSQSPAPVKAGMPVLWLSGFWRLSEVSSANPGGLSASLFLKAVMRIAVL